MWHFHNVDRDILGSSVSSVIVIFQNLGSSFHSQHPRIIDMGNKAWKLWTRSPLLLHPSSTPGPHMYLVSLHESIVFLTVTDSNWVGGTSLHENSSLVPPWVFPKYLINPETMAAPKISFWMIEYGPKCCIIVIFHPVSCLNWHGPLLQLRLLTNPS
jgi:hypothetical protein